MKESISCTAIPDQREPILLARLCGIFGAAPHDAAQYQSSRRDSANRRERDALSSVPRFRAKHVLHDNRRQQFLLFHPGKVRTPVQQRLQSARRLHVGTVRDDVSDVLFSTLSYRAPYLSGFGIQGDYGQANFNVRNAVHLSGGYELPFGKGKHFLNGGGWSNALTGGWRVNGLVTMQSGTPLTVGCTVSTTDGMGCDALLVPGQGLYTGGHTVAHWAQRGRFRQSRCGNAIGQSSYAPLGGAPTQVDRPPVSSRRPVHRKILASRREGPHRIPRRYFQPHQYAQLQPAGQPEFRHPQDIRLHHQHS